MPLIQPDRNRTGSPALAMSGMASAIALKISVISSLARLPPPVQCKNHFGRTERGSCGGEWYGA